MTYDTERQSVGRRPVTLVRLSLDSGNILLGVSDVSVSGDFDGDVIRPTIAPGSVRVTPARINFLDSEKLGEVGKVSFVVIDEPEATGTFWGKLLASDPYYLNRKCELLTGYFGTGLNTANFETRSYLIESIDGPDSSGRVQITAKHPLSELLGESSVCPAVSNAYLDGAITNSATAIDILPAGLITDWPASGKIRVNSEIISYAGKSSDQLTGCTRAASNTTAAAHADGDAVQLCVEFVDAALDEVITELLTYTNIPADYLDAAQWAAEVAQWLNADRLDRVLCNPEPVGKLIAEACADSLALFYFNERTSKFVLQAIAPQLSLGFTLDESNNILQNSQSVKTDLKEIATRVLVYYDKQNPVEDEKPANYRRAIYRVDGNRESAAQWDLIKTKIHFAKWVSASGSATISKLASRTLSRFGDGLKTIKFSLDAGDSSDAWTGDRVYLNSRLFQDSAGNKINTLVHIIEATEIDGHKREYVATLDVFSGSSSGGGGGVGSSVKKYGLVAPNGTPVYTSASATEKSKYVFIAQNSGLMTNSDDGYSLI